MPKLDTFYIAETHNGLVSNKDVAKAVVEIIRKGTASNLTRRSIRERGKIAEVSLATAATRQSRSVAEQSPPALFENLMTGVARDAFTMPVPSASLIGETTKSPASQAPPESNSPAEVTTFLDGDDFSLARLMIGRLKSNRLDISLAHGSIIDVTSRAYVFGVYKGVAPSGPANEIDQLLGGAISNFYERRAFGGEAGQIFMIPTLTFPCRCELVVLVGLGSFEDYLDGKRGSALRSRVAMELVQSLNRMGIDEFATVLWGGATAERQKLRLILADLMKGFVDAYKDIPVGMLRLRRIILCEYDVDIFKSIRSDLLSLSLSEQFNEQEFTLDEMKVIPSSKVHESVRASQERQRDRVYLMATKHEGESSSPDHVSIDLRVLRPSFKGAMPTRTREFSKREINDIVARVRGGYSPADAQKLTELVLDKDTHNFLASAMDLGELNDPVLIVMHDLATAIIPWELLSNSKPWAIAHGISRLAIMDCSARFLAERRRDPKLKILLVLSDPFGDLAGGRKEFEALKSMFFERFPDRIECRSIQGNDAVKDKLFDEFNSGRYDVVHYIGHAQFDVNDASRRGIYCFDQKFLTGEDIKFAQHLPTLVFLNGCESGRTRSLERMREAPVIIDPVQLAKEKPSIALGFLQGGITQFIGTYWPVGDASALDFAHELYGKLLDKTAIGEAICTARQKLYEGDKGNQQINSDWANYIHYGDPSFAIKVDSDVGSA
jgi:CHAT domain-containing protein